MNTGNADKDPGKAPDEKARKNPDPQLNRDINKSVQSDRFPESKMSKDSRKDAEEVAKTQEPASVAEPKTDNESRSQD